MTAPSPDITAVRVVSHGVLELTFADGRTGVVEVLPRMVGVAYEQARTVEGFAQVRVDSELGTIVWPGGADFAPDTLYEHVVTGRWWDERLAA